MFLDEAPVYYLSVTDSDTAAESAELLGGIALVDDRRGLVLAAAPVAGATEVLELDAVEADSTYARMIEAALASRPAPAEPVPSPVPLDDRDGALAGVGSDAEGDDFAAGAPAFLAGGAPAGFKGWSIAEAAEFLGRPVDSLRLADDKVVAFTADGLAVEIPLDGPDAD